MLSTAAALSTKYHECGCPSLSHKYNLLSHLSPSVCPLTDSMNFIANAFGSRPSSSNSQDSSISEQNESIEGGGAELQAAEGVNSSTQVIKKAKRRTSIPRTKTSFQLRYPPPTTKQKQRLSIRPKVLLQLHRISQATRPVPVFDVLPSVVFAPRLARKFPHTFKAKAGLGVDDLVVVSSEKYSAGGGEAAQADNTGANDKSNSREIIAAICQVARPGGDNLRKAELCFSQRGTWHGSALAKGGYEFITVDEHGKERMARWVPRKKRRTSENSVTGSSAAAPHSEAWAFNFSLIDPSSRRHAVIATMDARCIDVFDAYSKPSTALSSPTLDATAQSSLPPVATSIEVDEDLRTLIAVTGIWVAFCEQSGSKQEHGSSAMAIPPIPEISPGHKRRSLSLNIAHDRQPFAASSPVVDKMSQGRPNLTQSGSTPTIPKSPPAAQFPPPPRRTQSVSAAFLRRANSNRKSTTRNLNGDANSLAEDGFITDGSSATVGTDSNTSEPHLKESIPFVHEQTQKARKPRGFRRLFGSAKKDNKR